MKHFKITLCTMFSTLLLMGCVEEYNATLPTSESQLLVVEGTIMSDTLSTFYLSLTMPVNSTDSIYNVNDAAIKLVGTDGTSVTGRRTASGTYQMDIPKLNAATQYSLVVDYDGDTYESDAQYPFPSVAIQNIEANQPTETSDVNILVTTDVPSDTSETQYYRWTYDETWEMHPEITTVYYWDPVEKKALVSDSLYALRGWKYSTSGDIIASSSAYYSNNQIVQYKLYDIDRSDRRLYVLYSTQVTQRSLSKAEYEYETERKKISSEMGGLFTPQPSSLPTNIHCTTGDKRALGFVGCSLNLARFRLFVNPDSLHVSHKYTCTEITSNDEGYPGEQAMYQRGYLLSGYMDMPTEYDWATQSCLDITKLGCSTVMPTYWPR